MTISVRTRRDVVIVDPERFLAAAHRAFRELYPEASDAEAAEAVADVRDAADVLLERHGHLASDELAGKPAVMFTDRTTMPYHATDVWPPGQRATGRPDGLSPAGWTQAFVTADPLPLQDYGRHGPEDPFALPPGI